ncbi:serine hydrolase [Tunturiibacter gelidiferens]|uniref:serine hydrolase n=1 Tax=Tunturiibacter gelidiferens TaxID=3069689 RepID=UPI003D9B42F1
MSNPTNHTSISRSLTRRTLLHNLALTAAAVTAPIPKSLAQPQYGGSTGQQRGEMGRIAGAFRRQFSVPATSIAISRKAQFVFDQSVGMADRQHLTQASQDSLFRIASLSKPITSVTIFSLIEQGKLSLTDKVFGPSAILGIKYGKPPTSSTSPTSPSTIFSPIPPVVGPTTIPTP